jgi:hypothetical protein
MWKHCPVMFDMDAMTAVVGTVSILPVVIGRHWQDVTGCVCDGVGCIYWIYCVKFLFILSQNWIYYSAVVFVYKMYCTS